MRYFSFSEFERSETASRLKIDNRMPELAEAHIVELVDILLDPLREAWGGPLTVTSGYRCTELNRAVGGSETSAHLAGWAADAYGVLRAGDEILVDRDIVLTAEWTPLTGFAVTYTSDGETFAVEWLTATGLPFDQLIDERSGGSRWLHLGIRNLKGAQRRQVKVYDNGKYINL